MPVNLCTASNSRTSFGKPWVTVENEAYGIGLLLIGVVFMGAFGFGLFVPARRWGWIYGIVLIAVGLTSCCLLPATIPLLIFWLKPETQAFYGRG